MEARATFGGAKVSKTFVGAVLVVIALGVGVIGGYAAASLGGSKAATSTQVAPAAKTVVQKEMVPGYILQEIAPAAPAVRLSQDSPEFIARYATHDNLPAWLVQEISTPAGARLSQDDPRFIAQYAQNTEYVPGSEYATIP